MPSADTIKILVADDTLLRELSMKGEDLQSVLASRLSQIREDLARPAAEIRVTVIDDASALKAALAEKQWDFIALDNRWENQAGGGELGFALASQLRSQDGPNRETPLCIFTNQDWLESTHNINRIYKLDESIGDVGSFADFFPKPQRLPGGDASSWLRCFAIELLVRIKACFLLRALGREVRQLRLALDNELGLIGSNPAFKEALEVCRKVASTSATVLITGETGAGKELVARAIHHRSGRPSESFRAINCAAIPENLLESELFGHERGAFTGAYERKIGKFEQCDGGTIFLDEVGDMSLALQAKLLRVLQERQIERVGGTALIPVNVRVIAATNKRLEQMVVSKEFRDDLFYRLNVVRIEMPPLRQRRDDIPVLAQHLLDKFRRDHGKSVTSLDRDALKKLSATAYAWPGNVRELSNVIEKAVLLAEKSVISADDIELPCGTATLESHHGQGHLRASNEDLRAFLRRVERDEILSVLSANGGVQSRAAVALGMKANTLNDRIQRLDIQLGRPKS